MNLNEIKEALSKATAGPWMALPDAVRSNKGPGGWICQTYDESNGNIVEFENGEANTHLIANAPEWLASLVSHVEEMQSKVDLLQEEIFYEKRAALENHERYVSEYQKVEEMQKALDRIHTDTTDAWASGFALRTLQSLKGATK